jgi:lipoyl(octanoyl) transferase
MEWKISDDLVEYPDAIAFMENRVAAIRDGSADELIWLLEHPPVYTAGTSAKSEDLLTPQFPVFETGRGGQYTYHGPGQLVGYVMLDLKKRQTEHDLKLYIHNLEKWIIETLAVFGIQGERRQGRVGIWVAGTSGEEAKIAAIGVRVRHWITYHGISINLNPDLTHFNGIVPCGINEHGVTSFQQLGKEVCMADLEQALQETARKIFG